MRRLLWFVVALICFSIATPGYAQETKRSTEPPTLSARGHVIDPQGRPVAGARVVLREWPTIRRSDDPSLKEFQDILAEMKSDNDGRFAFVDVPSRPFRAFRDSKPWDVVALSDGFAPGCVHLARAADDRELTVRLEIPKSVSGRLTDPEGQPIEGCKVHVASVDAPGSPPRTNLDDPTHFDLWSSQLAPRATTDKDGRFEIAGVPADKRLTLLAEHPDFARRGGFFVGTTENEQSPVEDVSVSSDGKRTEEQRPVYVSGFTETLKRGMRIRGRVVLADTGQPVPNAKVNHGSIFEVADNEGRFEFTSVTGPSYDVQTSADQRGYLGARETVTFSDGQWKREIELRLPRGETVRGSVVDEETGVGVANVGVTYRPADYDEKSPWSPSKPTTTDAAGRFEITVPPGLGEIQVYGSTDRHATHDIPDFWRWRAKQGISPHHAAKIDVVAGQPTDEVVLKVGRGLVIRGSVVDERGKPAFAAEVKTTDRYGRTELGKKTITDDQGRFELGGFPPHEEQQIDVSDPTTHLVGDAVVPADEKAGANRLVELPAIQLRSTGRVVGKVLADGMSLAGVDVSLQREVDPPKLEGVEKRPGQSWWRAAQKTTTDADGRYEFDLVDAGKQFMVSVRPDGYTDKNSRTHKVKAGETVEVPVLELKSRAAFVAGIVVDPDGKPVPGVTVSARERDGGGISYGRRGPSPKTGPDGRFRLEDLPNVPLELMAYIRAPEPTKDRTIHFPAQVNAEPNQTDVRIVLDPKLQRPLP